MTASRPQPLTVSVLTPSELAVARVLWPVVEAPHDPEWEADRAGFCARLCAMGLSYNRLKDYCEAHERPKPSSGGRAYRRRILDAGDRLTTLITRWEASDNNRPKER